LRAQGVRASARLLAAEVLCNAARGEHATADGRWSLLVAHVPSEEQARSRVEHLRALREWGASHAGGPALLVGDLNTSRAGLDVPRAGQKHEALLGEVWTTGLRDVWHEQGGSHTQTSWRGPMGERQRLDTALASPALLTQGVRLRYVDEPELSDHAGVVVEWGGDTRE
jgi:endonuclease/exonuclease/phosphatase family metal-dependent hydrolase